ncbi:MMPL family transporter [Lactobacillaceae bacterium L1_55_11]|nr:MMPL family transporter [Lactobacillaceae bacterium L1_55_11]
MLERLGKWIYRHKYWTLLGWAVLLVALIAGAVGGGSHFSSSLSISGIPSTEIQSTLEKEFNQNPNAGTMKVVIQNKKDGGVSQDQIKNQVTDAINQVNKDYGKDVKSVTNPYDSSIISSDKTTTYVDITFDKGPTAVSSDTINGIRHIFDKKVDTQGTKLAYTGSVQITKMDLGGTSEVIGIVLAFILLLILFRSFVTAGLPIGSALVGLGIGTLLITIGTNFFDLANVAQTLAVMLSLAVGIDYALFILNRYKTDLASTDGDRETALGRAVSEAGKSVIFAGVTVIVAVCGLSLVGIDFLSAMGFAAGVAVFFAMLSALTLLPALISVAGRFIKPNNKSVQDMVKHPSWGTRFLTGHPWVVTIVGIAVLAGLALPAQHMRFGMPYNGSLPEQRTERQAYDIISDKFGEGVNAPLVAVIQLDPKDQDNAANLTKMADHIQNLKGAKQIVPVVDKTKAAQVQQQLTAQAQQQMAAQAQATGQMPTDQDKDKAAQQIKAAVLAQASKPYQLSSDGKYALMIVIPKEGSVSKQTGELTQKIKDYSKTTQHDYDAKITLTGVNAVNIDITDKLDKATPVFAGIIILLAFILLMVVFKSFVVPLVAMAGFALSLLASFGLTTAVIQDGFMKSLFGISKGAPLLSFLPVIVIGILFGLAMDYEVFMVSRAREIFVKTGNNDEAVTVALQDSGPIVITAALIMIAVFGSFALNSDPTVKSLGLALAFGVFSDAFIVRLLIVPSLLKILGRWNWVFPGQKHK